MMIALEDKLLLVQAAINNALTLDMDPVVVLQAGDAVIRQVKSLPTGGIQRAFDSELSARLSQKQSGTDTHPPFSHRSCLSVEQLRTDAPFLHPCSCVE